MANTYLIEVGINDALQDVIRKVNKNFQLLSANQSQQSKTGLRNEATRTDNAIAGAVGEIKVEVENATKELEAALDKALKDIADSTIPMVGTYIMCDYDPNKQWPSSTWVRLEDIESIDLPIWKRTE